MSLVRNIFRQIGRLIVGERVAGKFNSVSNGTTTLSPAETPARNVLIVVEVTETFATNAGTKPTFKIGQSGTTNKYADTASFSGGVKGDILTFAGSLSTSSALLVTATAAVGAAKGAISVEAVIVPATF